MKTVEHWTQPNSHGLQPTSDCLQSKCDGLQPNSDGLQPNSDGLSSSESRGTTRLSNELPPPEEQGRTMLKSSKFWEPGVLVVLGLPTFCSTSTWGQIAHYLSSITVQTERSHRALDAWWGLPSFSVATPNLEKDPGPQGRPPTDAGVPQPSPGCSANTCSAPRRRCVVSRPPILKTLTCIVWIKMYSRLRWGASDKAVK